MSISYMTDCLMLVVKVFEGFPLLMWILAAAIICSIVNVMRYIAGGRSIW